jgi:UDP-glucose:(heptosyl)LPS alpha-1,3-glucosyltransferase
VRAAVVLDRFDSAGGGLERWTIGFASFLAGRGHDVHVVAFETAPEPPVPVHVLLPARGVLGRARRVAACVARLEADVVLDTGTGWSGDVFMPCTGSRRSSQRQLLATQPPVLRLRSAISPRSVLLDWSMARLERAQVRQARQVVAVSSRVRDLLCGRYGIAPGRVTVIPNGVETCRFAPDVMAALRAGARSRLGVGGATVFLGSAHNMALKGMDTAIEALRALVREGADAMLVIAGRDPDAKWRARADGLGCRVRFMGLVDDMTPLFAAADALVHPTRWDACSLSTLEAGAAGLPVITTVRDGASELIREGETGFVLGNPEDVPALAGRMRLLLDPALRARMGLAARAAARGHDVRANYEAVEAVLLANSRGGSARAAGP